MALNPSNGCLEPKSLLVVSVACTLLGLCHFVCSDEEGRSRLSDAQLRRRPTGQTIGLGLSL